MVMLVGLLTVQMDGQFDCLGDGTECIPGSYYCDGSIDNGNAGWPADCSNGADEDLATCCDAGLYDAGTCGGGGIDCDLAWDMCLETLEGTEWYEACSAEDCEGGAGAPCDGNVIPTLSEECGAVAYFVYYGECEDPCGYGGGNDLECGDGESVVTFELADSFGDGWNGGFIDFNGEVLSVEEGSAASFSYCLTDGDYAYTYTAGGWSYENSWTITDDGDLIASGAGSGSEGESFDSSFSVGTVLEAPGTPENFTATPGFDGQSIVVLSWDAVEGANQYNVYFNDPSFCGDGTCNGTETWED